MACVFPPLDAAAMAGLNDRGRRVLAQVFLGVHRVYLVLLEAKKEGERDRK